MKVSAAASVAAGAVRPALVDLARVRRGDRHGQPADLAGGRLRNVDRRRESGCRPACRTACRPASRRPRGAARTCSAARDRGRSRDARIPTDRARCAGRGSRPGARHSGRSAADDAAGETGLPTKGPCCTTTSASHPAFRCDGAFIAFVLRRDRRFGKVLHEDIDQSSVLPRASWPSTAPHRRPTAAPCGSRSSPRGRRPASVAFSIACGSRSAASIGSACCMAA